MEHDEFIEANRRSWDDRSSLHAQPTSGYRLDQFATTGPCSATLSTSTNGTWVIWPE
jgi:hypothetical protein